MTDTLGGAQKATFLTEVGLYKIIFRSNKPWAEQFQDFACDAIKEIRKTGEYNLKKQLEEHQMQLEELNLFIPIFLQCFFTLVGV